jgi:hypothetical protein
VDKLYIFDPARGYPARCRGQHDDIAADPVALTGLPTAIGVVGDLGDAETRAITLTADPGAGGVMVVDERTQALWKVERELRQARLRSSGALAEAALVLLLELVVVLVQQNVIDVQDLPPAVRRVLIRVRDEIRPNFSVKDDADLTEALAAKAEEKAILDALPT